MKPNHNVTMHLKNVARRSGKSAFFKDLKMLYRFE